MDTGSHRSAAWPALALAGLAYVLPACAAPGGSEASGTEAQGAAGSAEETGEDTAGAEIRQLLREQVDAWNRADLDGFLRHYHRGPDLVFTSGVRVRRGYEALEADFKSRYAGAAAMGRLTMDGIEVHPIGDTAAWVLGNWHLERSAGPAGGNFTLILTKEGGVWKIVHDHTSVTPTPPEKPPEVASPRPGGAGRQPPR